MPPFRLELPDYVPLSRSINKRLIYSQNEYSPAVKVTDWNYNNVSYPFDADPFCPGAVNHFISHYKRFGTEADEKYETTTHCMLEEIKTRDLPKYNIPTRKYMVNYFGYNDTMPCKTSASENAFCPELCAPDYLTTMQDSFSPPYPFAMKGLTRPIPPFLKYRKLHEDRPELSSYKFYDEGFVPHVKKLQKHKMQQYISFNPLTGKMSDGSDAGDKLRKCYKLEYDNRELPTKCYSSNIDEGECNCLPPTTAS